MSVELFRELARNIENTLHERFKIMEEILSSVKQSAQQQKPSELPESSSLLPRIVELEQHFQSLDEYTMGQVRTLAFNHDQLEKRVESLENSMKSALTSFQAINETIGMMQVRINDEKPVEAAEVEAEIEETEEAALDADTEEQEEEVVEEEEEQEELDIEEIVYKKKTWWRDQHNRVYPPSEDGVVDPNSPYGIWNPTLKKIEPYPST